MFQIYDSSDEVKIVASSKTRKVLYPWALLKIGKSFGVPKNKIKEISLINMAAKAGRRYGKVFVVHDHGTSAYEVACVGVRPASVTPANRNAEVTGKIKTEKVSRVAPFPQNAPVSYGFDPEPVSQSGTTEVVPGKSWNEPVQVAGWLPEPVAAPKSSGPARFLDTLKKDDN